MPELTVPPAAETTTVLDPTRFVMSAFEPTAAMVPSVPIATASAAVPFPVHTRPFLITVAAALGLGGFPAALASVGTPASNPAAAVAPEPARNLRRPMGDDDISMLLPANPAIHGRYRAPEACVNSVDNTVVRVVDWAVELSMMTTGPEDAWDEHPRRTHPRAHASRVTS
jgi:hypothetical protein